MHQHCEEILKLWRGREYRFGRRPVSMVTGEPVPLSDIETAELVIWSNNINSPVLTLTGTPVEAGAFEGVDYPASIQFVLEVDDWPTLSLRTYNWLVQMSTASTVMQVVAAGRLIVVDDASAVGPVCPPEWVLQIPSLRVDDVVIIPTMGYQGIQGPAGTIEIGTITTSEPGGQGDVTNSGTAENAVLDFIVPQGPVGPSGTIQIAETLTTAPGELAEVTNLGTDTAAILQFSLPQGIQGPEGPPVSQRTSDLIEATSLLAGNLIFNGRAEMAQPNNFNFSSCAFTNDHPTGASRGWVPAANGLWVADELIPVNTTWKYWLSAWFKSAAGVSGIKMGLWMYDRAGNRILGRNVAQKANTATTLAADLNPGDSVINLAAVNTSYWDNSTNDALRWIVVWDWTDEGGTLWPGVSYSRDVLAYPQGALNSTAKTITLSQQYDGPVLAAGRAVGNAGIAVPDDCVPTGMTAISAGSTWAEVAASAAITGIGAATATSGLTFRPGVTHVRPFVQGPDVSDSADWSNFIFANACLYCARA